MIELESRENNDRHEDIHSIIPEQSVQAELKVALAVQKILMKVVEI